MEKIFLRNTSILTKLEELSTWFFEFDPSVFNIGKSGMTAEHAVSEKYFQSVYKRGINHTGYPDDLYGIDFSVDPHSLPEYLKEKVLYYKYKFNELLGSKFNALMCYYPPGGYITWHTNWNVSGLNILFTYSKTGDGQFLYKDPITLETKIIQDEPGWNCKMGYYGKMKEQDQICWHAASTNCDRLTVSYVIPDKNLWNDLKEDLESEE
jgi:hypothetical protein